MGLDEGCEQVTLFLEDIWNGIKDKPAPKNEVACTNLKNIGVGADMISIIGAKLKCPDAEIQAHYYGKIKGDIFVKLIGCKK